MALHEETTSTATPIADPTKAVGTKPTAPKPGTPPPTTPAIQFPATETLERVDQGQVEMEAYVAGQVFLRPEYQVFNGFISPVAALLNRTSLEFPEIREMVRESLGQALAYTDADFRAAMSSGAPQSEIDIMIEAFLQETVITGAEGAYASALLADSDQVRGRYEAAAVDRRDVALQAAQQVSDPFSLQSTLATVGEVTSAVSDRPGEWSFDGTHLAGSIEVKVPGLVKTDDGGETAQTVQSTFLITLDEGTQITNDLEAQVAMVLAFAGLAHQVDGDDLAGPQLNAGRFIETVVGPWARSPVTEAAFRTTLIGHQALVAMSDSPLEAGQAILLGQRGERTDVPTQAQALAMVETNLPDHQRLGIYAAVLDGELRDQGVILAAPQLQELLAENLSADEFNRLKDEDAESVINEARESGVDQGTLLTQGFDTGVEKLFEAAELWESVTQWLGVQYFDVATDISEATTSLARGNIDEAFASLQRTIELSDEETVGDFFGLRGSARSWANLGASIVFDPTNLLFAGGASRRIMMEALVTNPALAPLAMRTRGMKGLVDNLLESAVAGADEFIGPIAITTDRTGEALRTLAVVEGIRPEANQRLMDLVASGRATRDEIEAVFINEFASGGTGGTFIPASFGNATRRNTAVGMYELARKFAGLSDEGRTQVASLVMMLSDDSTVVLRGAQGFDQVKQTVISLFPDDPDRVFRLLRSYTDQTGGGLRTIENLEAVRIQNSQKLQELLDTEIPGAMGVRESGYDLAGVQAQIGTLETAASGAARVVDPALADDLTRLRDIESQIVTRRRNVKELKDEVNRLVGEIESVQSYMAHPFAEADTVLWWQNFYEDLADELDIPFLFNKAGEKIQHPYLPEAFQRDWAHVTGRNTDEVADRVYGDNQRRLAREGGLVPSAENTFGLPADEVKNISDTAANIDVFAQRGHMEAPVTAMELVVYRSLKDDPKALTQFFNQMNRLRQTKALNVIRTIFNTNLLINLSTPVKTRLDESLRLLFETGNVEDFLRSTMAFIPGSEGNLSSEAAQFAREIGGIDSTQWGFQLQYNTPGGKAPKGWVGAGERFLNGSLAADDLAKHWAAREAGNLTDAQLAEWWTSTGSQMYRGSEVALSVGEDGGGKVIVSHASEPLDAFDQIINSWLDRVIDPSKRQQLKDRIIEVLDGGSKFSIHNSADAELIRQLNFLPMSGQDAVSITGQRVGVFNPLWNTMYGRPGQRAGGVFFDNYFDYALNLYTKSYEKAGKLLTPQMLVERFGLSPAEATSLLNRAARNPRLLEAFGQGFVTEEYLRVQAKQYARSRADDLMYSLVTKSIAGSAVDNPVMLPFFRAQTDFLSYWHRQFTEGTISRIPRETLQRWNEGNIAQRTVGRVVEGAERIPVNARLLSRWAHLAAAADEEDASPGSPGWFLNRFTFLPLRNGPGFLLNVAPQPGFGASIPWWMLEDKLDDPAWMETVERVFGGLAISNQRIGSELDWSDGFNAVLPGNDRSIVGAARNTGDLLTGLPGGDIPSQIGRGAGSLMQYITGQILEQSEPAGINTTMRINMGNSDIWTMIPGSDEMNAEVARVSGETRQQLTTQQGYQGLQAQVAGLGDPEYDAGHIEFYLPLVTSAADGGYLEMMEAAGKVTDLDRDDLFGVDDEAGLIAKFRAGNISQDELRALNDIMSTMLFDRASEVDFGPARPKFNADGELIGEIAALPLIEVMLIEHPELAINMVSNQQCVADASGAFFSDTHCSADGRIINVPQGPEGRDLRSEWKRNGDIGYLPEQGENGWVMQARLRVETARGRMARYLWASVTGREYSQQNLVATDAQVFTLSDGLRRRADQIGMVLPTQPTNGEDLRGYWSRFINDTLIHGDINAAFYDSPTWAAMGNNHDLDQATGEPTLYSAEGVELVRKSLNDYLKTNGVSLYDLPEDVRTRLRDTVFAPALTHGIITEAEYARDAQRIFGPLDYEPPSPPSLDSPDIDFRRTFTGSALAAGELVVLDGDTLRATTDDGFVDFRLVGINTPEEGQRGHLESRRALDSILRDANTIDLIIFDPERYGRVQTWNNGRERVKVWLYVNGTPIWVEASFGSANPSGVEFGGTVVDYRGIFESNGGSMTAIPEEVT